MFNEVIVLVPQILMVIAFIALVVSVITEVIKGVKCLAVLPTDLVVFVLSIVVTALAYFTYCAYAARAIAWYEIIGAIIAGFFIAFVTMFGWEKLTTLWKRLKPPSQT